MIVIRNFDLITGVIIIAEIFEFASANSGLVHVCKNVEFIGFIPSKLGKDGFTQIEGCDNGVKIKLNILGVEIEIQKSSLIFNPTYVLSKIAALGGIIYDEKLLIKYLLQCE